MKVFSVTSVIRLVILPRWIECRAVQSRREKGVCPSICPTVCHTRALGRSP